MTISVLVHSNIPLVRPISHSQQVHATQLKSASISLMTGYL